VRVGCLDPLILNFKRKELKKMELKEKIELNKLNLELLEQKKENLERNIENLRRKIENQEFALSHSRTVSEKIIPEE